MSTFWKVMVGLLLTLPVGAYVTGTLVAADPGLPAERRPIVISDASADQAPPGGPATSGARPDRGSGSAGQGDDDGDDQGRGRGRGGDDDEVEVVRPSPDDIDDHDDDAGRDDDRDDDRSGDGDDDD